MNKVPFRCSSCQQSLTADDTLAGKRVRCPKCQTILTIPQAGQDEAVVASTPPGKPEAPPVAPAPPGKVVPDAPPAVPAQAPPSGADGGKPAENANASPSETYTLIADHACPSCGWVGEPGAVICLECGLDRRTGRKLVTRIQGSPHPCPTCGEMLTDDSSCPTCRLASQVLPGSLNRSRSANTTWAGFVLKAFLGLVIGGVGGVLLAGFLSLCLFGFFLLCPPPATPDEPIRVLGRVPYWVVGLALAVLVLGGAAAGIGGSIGGFLCGFEWSQTKKAVLGCVLLLIVLYMVAVCGAGFKYPDLGSMMVDVCSFNFLVLFFMLFFIAGGKLGHSLAGGLLFGSRLNAEGRSVPPARQGTARPASGGSRKCPPASGFAWFLRAGVLLGTGLVVAGFFYGRWPLGEDLEPGSGLDGPMGWPVLVLATLGLLGAVLTRSALANLLFSLCGLGLVIGGVVVLVLHHPVDLRQIPHLGLGWTGVPILDYGPSCALLGFGCAIGFGVVSVAHAGIAWVAQRAEPRNARRKNAAAREKTPLLVLFGVNVTWLRVGSVLTLLGGLIALFVTQPAFLAPIINVFRPGPQGPDHPVRAVAGIDEINGYFSGAGTDDNDALASIQVPEMATNFAGTEVPLIQIDPKNPLVGKVPRKVRVHFFHRQTVTHDRGDNTESITFDLKTGETLEHRARGRVVTGKDSVFDLLTGDAAMGSPSTIVEFPNGLEVSRSSEDSTTWYFRP